MAQSKNSTPVSSRPDFLTKWWLCSLLYSGLTLWLSPLCAQHALSANVLLTSPAVYAPFAFPPEPTQHAYRSGIPLLLAEERHRRQPFFCREEDRRDRKGNYPIRFRLGAYPYVQYLEGKGHDWIPHTGR
jgi:hypothetical protein